MAGPTTVPSIPESKVAQMNADVAAPIVLDLGKQRRKSIRRLRRGSGKLMDEISGAIDELRSAGAIGASAQPIIVVVQQKRRRRSDLLPGLPGF